VFGNDFDRQVASVAALGEPIRRVLYRYVVAQGEPVSRERAAAGVGVALHVAKFHLDKLEEDGLLDVEYRRPPGRTGPGAGRPAKLYRRSARQIAVSLPERRYDLAGHILAEAVSAAQRAGLPVDGLVAEAARAAGRELNAHAGPEVEAEAAPLEAARQALARNGYEPRADDGRLTLANCPFHQLAQSHRGLICNVNLELINGLLNGLPVSGRLDPAPGRCCVAVETN
jgi:predicted ArsR family transcriptional regulator